MRHADGRQGRADRDDCGSRASAKDGDTIDILPGEYHADVAVWLQKRLTIRGVGETPVLKADGRSAEGKAIWVLRNGEFVIENIAFEGARVDDRNGAGVRFERGSRRYAAAGSATTRTVSTSSTTRC